MRKIQQIMIPLLTFVAACLLTTALYAKTINLLEEPKDNAKVTGTVDLSAGIIPIFTPKDGLWIKIADPRNGNTGWVKRSDLKDASGNIMQVQQSVSEDKSGNKVQSVEMSYGNAQLTPEQKKAMQQQIPADSLKLMQENLQQMQKVYQQQLEIMQKMGFPPVPGVTAPVNVNQNQQNLR